MRALLLLLPVDRFLLARRAHFPGRHRSKDFALSGFRRLCLVFPLRLPGTAGHCRARASHAASAATSPASLQAGGTAPLAPASANATLGNSLKVRESGSNAVNLIAPMGCSPGF